MITCRAKKQPSRLLRIYTQRWNIETLVRAYKTRARTARQVLSCKQEGFDRENTYIPDLKCSEQLFALLVLAFVWAVQVDEFVSSLRPSEIKKHGYAEWSLYSSNT